MSGSNPLVNCFSPTQRWCLSPNTSDEINIVIFFITEKRNKEAINDFLEMAKSNNLFDDVFQQFNIILFMSPLFVYIYIFTL